MPPPGQDLPSRVLLITDDVSVSDAVSRVLRLEGFEVWAAFSAQEGVRLAKGHAPDAVLIDLRTPAVANLPLVQALRREAGLSRSPIAVVTGDHHPDAAVLGELDRLGATVRYKPFWLTELVSLARDLLRIPARP